MPPSRKSLGCSSDSTPLNINSKLATIQSVVISDINGRTVKSIAINQTNTQVNVSDLNSGAYFYEVKTVDGLVSRNTFMKK